MPEPRPPLPPPFDQVDAARIERHAALVALWHELPAEELASDLSVLAQLVAFKARQEQLARQVVDQAREMHRQGATHDCREWRNWDRCLICGKEGKVG